MEERIILSRNLNQELAMAISECEHDRIFVLTDETTRRLCWPVLEDFFCLKPARHITIKAGDTNKTLDSLADVWRQLQQGGATRHSLLVCLGGGMVTDLGGFAAATFKRGIDCINLPTTLLSMVDASVGGKTGINFGGLKNEIGAFSDPRYVILSTRFLQTLDRENLLSGYAEMLKHSLIATPEMWAAHVSYDWNRQTAASEVTEGKPQPASTQLADMIAQSVEVKKRVVTVDPHEHGLRKALNLGHTVGHAFESWAMRQGHPVLHGYAVAFGLICELYLSAVKTHFPADRLRQTVTFIRENYGSLPVTCDDYPALVSLMRHDKKNTAGTINFTLLADIGDLRLNQTATEEEIKEALDFFREAV